MAFHFQRDEPVRDGVKRILTEEIDSAVKRLASCTKGNSEETIHEVRKSIKKIRAVLRLVRGPLGNLYTPENIRWRNIGRRLSAIRDADAILATFDDLQKKYKLAVRKDGAGAVRRMLLQRRAEAAKDAAPVIAAALRAIRPGARRVNAWVLEPEGFALIEPGLDRTYKRGRKALAAVQEGPSDELYHELRKRTKDLWYQARLLEPVWPEPMEGYENNLDDLQEWLGDDHNLSLLRDLVKESGAARVETAIANYQAELRERSLALAERMYAAKPSAYARDIRRYWRSWYGRPKRAS